MDLQPFSHESKGAVGDRAVKDAAIADCKSGFLAGALRGSAAAGDP
jgi:hypothetical protein